MGNRSQEKIVVANTHNYYDEVGKYFDYEAPQYSNKKVENIVYQKIRDSFRSETDKYSFDSALEIGFGPGEDLLYFSKKYPGRNFCGIDVSTGMYQIASDLMEKNDCKNVTVKKGSIDDVSNIFLDKKFDIIYSYFGALNTIEDLEKTSECFKNILTPGGKIVITVINKWYMMGILVPFIKGRWNIAFKRLHKVWGGYSPYRHLDSKCYTPKDIINAFAPLKLLENKGYSILYPAWYQNHLAIKLGNKAKLLWKIDTLLNKTPLWSLGEYTLFVFEH